ncbi:hypothetical protein Taro_028576 [Colocasia esculenta]|uniref:ACB domain-containing protein n=1 Tax=Colocasia esculenta TaxID=4460 RepID=A0A843VQS8_COLES|nr:hypothetical protein [Colocasia esculenta]
MELLLELLLTMVVSVLIAFLLGKIVDVAAPDEEDPNGREEAGGLRAPPVTQVASSEEAAALGSRVGFGGEVGEEVEAIGEIGARVHGKGRETLSGGGDGCDEVEEDRSAQEAVRREEEKEEVVVEGVVLGSEEAADEELGMEEVGGGEKVHGTTVEGTEESLAEIGRAMRCLATDENPLVAEDAVQVVNAAPSHDEEEGVAKELGTDEVSTESVDGEIPAVVEAHDEKAVPCGTAAMVVLESEAGGPETNVKNEKVGLLFKEDDDWEGIEKSDLEKLFAAATAFAASNNGSKPLARLSNDLQMQLYGLHKIATEGPCYESQPMSLKVSARAKWHAWQRLGSMNPEMAMEQYITLVSDNIPGWMLQKNRVKDYIVEGKGNSPDEGLSGSGAAFSSSLPEDLSFQFQTDEGNLESDSYIRDCNVPVVSEGSNQGKSRKFPFYCIANPISHFKGLKNDAFGTDMEDATIKDSGISLGFLLCSAFGLSGADMSASLAHLWLAWWYPLGRLATPLVEASSGDPLLLGGSLDLGEGFPNTGLKLASTENQEEGTFGDFLGLPKESFNSDLDPFGDPHIPLLFGARSVFLHRQELGVKALAAKISSMRPAILPSNSLNGQTLPPSSSVQNSKLFCLK